MVIWELPHDYIRKCNLTDVSSRIKESMVEYQDETYKSVQIWLYKLKKNELKSVFIIPFRNIERIAFPFFSFAIFKYVLKYFRFKIAEWL